MAPDAAPPSAPDAAPPDAAPGNAPVISDQQVSTAEDTAVAITIEATDPDDDALQFTWGVPTSGTVAGTPPALTYTPNVNFNGTDTFTVEVSDGVLTDTATITVTVTPVNDGPVAHDQAVGYETDIAVAITLVATDAEGDDLTFTIVDQPENGELSGDGAARTYTPEAGFDGQDSFTFRASDGTVESNLARVTITPIPEDCGNGAIDPPEECDDGNTDSGDGCTSLCTLERCGDGLVNNGGVEVCDDANNAAGDGCRADCRGHEECGDGFTDSLVGEECDDDGTGGGDGCDSECRFEEPFVSVPAQPISGALSCTTDFSSYGRKAGVDQLGRFYVVMNCGGEAHVAVSADRGATWSAPVATGLAGVTEVAIEGGTPGVAQIVAVADNDVMLTRTTDGGATWQPVSTIVTRVTNNPSIGLASFEDAMLISFSLDGDRMRILRNEGGGQDGFASVDIDQPGSPDLVMDQVTGIVASVSDTVNYHVRISSDQGLSFGAEFAPPGQSFFSEWAGSNGFLYVIGYSGTNIDVIPIANPGTRTQVSGLPGATAGLRAMDADALGNAYVVSELGTGNVRLDRMGFGATAIDPADARAIAAGSKPVVAALPSNNGALVAYTNGTTIYAAVIVY